MLGWFGLVVHLSLHEVISPMHVYLHYNPPLLLDSLGSTFMESRIIKQNQVQRNWNWSWNLERES